MLLKMWQGNGGWRGKCARSGLRLKYGALEQLSPLDKSISGQVLKKLRWRVENFDQATHLPLTDNLKGVFKLRVGDYRALYTFDDENLTVHLVQHRREVYKSK